MEGREKKNIYMEINIEIFELYRFFSFVDFEFFVLFLKHYSKYILTHTLNHQKQQKLQRHLNKNKRTKCVIVLNFKRKIFF